MEPVNLVRIQRSDDVDLGRQRRILENSELKIHHFNDPRLETEISFRDTVTRASPEDLQVAGVHPRPSKYIVLFG